MTDRATLFHEAGHAVAATVFGFDVRWVQLHPPGTRANSAGTCHTWREDLDADPERALYYMFSGSAAEQRLTGRPSRGAWADREEAARRAALLCKCADTDDPRVRARLAAAEAVALGLMYDPIVWRAIERVAKDLERKGRLTGRDVQLHLRQARR